MSEITPIYQVPNITKYSRVDELEGVAYVTQRLSEGWELLGIFPNHGQMKDDYPVIYVIGKE